MSVDIMLGLTFYCEIDSKETCKACFLHFHQIKETIHDDRKDDNAHAFVISVSELVSNL